MPNPKALMISGILIVIGLFLKIPFYLRQHETLSIIGIVLMMIAIIYYCLTLIKTK